MGPLELQRAARRNLWEQKLLRGSDLEGAIGQVREDFCVSGGDPREF